MEIPWRSPEPAPARATRLRGFTLTVSTSWFARRSVSESAAILRGAVRAFATVVLAAAFNATLPCAFAVTLAFDFAATLLFAITFALAGADFLAFTADGLALAFAFGAGFCFFAFLGAAFFLAMPGV